MSDTNPPSKEHGWRSWARLVVAPVAVAVAIAALTPMGDHIREYLFPTKAAVTGAVTLRGAGAAGAALRLDGDPAGATDDNGAFLLTGVRAGRHVLEAHAPGSYLGRVEFSVARGSTERKVDPLAVRPLIELGYAILVLGPRPGSGRGAVRYDIVLWIDAAPEVQSRIRRVSYVLPAPLPKEPVTASTTAGHCFRLRGTLAYEELTGSPRLASAGVGVILQDGSSFSATTAPGETLPPVCPVEKAKKLRVPAEEFSGSRPRANWPPGAAPEPKQPVNAPEPAPSPSTEPEAEPEPEPEPSTLVPEPPDEVPPGPIADGPEFEDLPLEK